MAMNMVMAMAVIKRPDHSRRARRRGFISERSASAWGLRGAFAILAVALGAASVAGAFAASIRSTDPARAHALAPWDGRITGQLALKQSLDLQEKGAISFDKGLARRALVQDATAVAAVTALGLQAEWERNKAQARRLFAYGQQLTRRDLLAQLWAIEDSVARNDVAGTVRHYDIALRTSKLASEILFPVLVNALDDAQIRADLVRTLISGPPWAGLFIEYAAANGNDPSATALLFRELDRRGRAVSSVARELLIARLASKGLFEEAWTYYVSFHSYSRREVSRDPNFTAELAYPTLFDWQLVAADGLSASIQSGLLDVGAPPSVGGVLVRQTQMLPAGEYVLNGHSIGIEQSETGRPYWALTCHDGREIGRIAVPNSAMGKGNFSGSITVPADCPVQVLALIARPSDVMPGLRGQFDRLQLTQIGQRGDRR